MSESLEAALIVLRNYVSANRLTQQVSLSLEGTRIRITLLAEGRDLWLGSRYYLLTDPTEEPRAFFELNDLILSDLLGLPPGPGAAPRGAYHSLFVSYSRADEALMVPVVDLLRLTDAVVFRDKDGIRAGDRWRQTIDQAIDECTECLVFWCEHAACSEEVAREIGRANRLGKRIVPIMLDDSPLTSALREFQAIDMRRFEPHSWTRSAAERRAKTGVVEQVSPGKPSASQEAAAAYLRQQLSDLLGVTLQPLVGEGQPNVALEPTAPSVDE
jgi:hypothetical protein